MAIINPGPEGGIIGSGGILPASASQAGLLEALGLVLTLLPGSEQQDPSAAGAQVAGAFVDLSRVPKFNVTDAGLADTEFAVVHNLGAIPTFVIPLPHEGQTVAGAPYASGTAWTSTTVYLKFPSANANIWIGLAV